MRKIIVASAVSNKSKQYNTDAETWGELKPVISELLVGDVEAIVKTSEGTLQVFDDSTPLPYEDLRVYLVAKKNKSGAISVSDARNLAEEIAAALVEAAEKATKEDVNELRQELRGTIESFFGVELGGADCEECAEALDEAKEIANNR